MSLCNTFKKINCLRGFGFGCGFQKPQLSACIIAFNEADRIRDCIESLSFCDEVLVVDSHSQDETRQIAAECGARVIERDWPGFAAQKEFAIRQALYDWVLCIDADERVSDKLRDEILVLREAGFAEKAGWRMPRLSYYLDAWVEHGSWRPDWSLRLFDKRRGNWGNKAIHERVELNGPMGTLKNDLLHYPYRSLAEHLSTMDRYTSIMAESMHSRGKKASLRHIVINPWVRFIKYYFIKRGFLDGWRGLVIAYLAAQYVRTKYIKLMVLQRVGQGTD